MSGFRAVGGGGFGKLFCGLGFRVQVSGSIPGFRIVLGRGAALWNLDRSRLLQECPFACPNHWLLDPLDPAFSRRPARSALMHVGQSWA